MADGGACTAVQVMPVMGFLDSGSQIANAHLVAALRQGLKEIGYVEGQNVMIEYRWANGEYDRLTGVGGRASTHPPLQFLHTGGGEPAARAAKAATTTIPIVFDSSSSPVDLGLVASLNRPGGNMTGVNQMVEELVTKELGLLHKLIPQAQVIAMLVDPNSPRTKSIVRNAQTAVRALWLQSAGPDKLAAEQDIDTAFTTLAQQRIGALFVAPAPFFYNRRDRIIALAARHCDSHVVRSAGFCGSRWPHELRHQSHRIHIDRLAFTPGGFSRARSPPTFQSCSRRNSS